MGCIAQQRHRQERKIIYIYMGSLEHFSSRNIWYADTGTKKISGLYNMIACRLVFRYYFVSFSPTDKKLRVFGGLEILMNTNDQSTRESMMEIHFQIIQGLY